MLISLGGGPRRVLVQALLGEIGRRWPGLEILLPSPTPPHGDRPGVTGGGVAGVDCRVVRDEGFGDVGVHVDAPNAGSRRHGAIRTVAAPDGLGEVLAHVDVAILAGGVSLYEAVAAGVPSVAIAVVPAQHATIAGFAARDLVCDGGAVQRHTSPAVARRVADHLARIMGDGTWRRRVRREGPRAVDGRGVTRVAGAVVAVAEGRHHA